MSEENAPNPEAEARRNHFLIDTKTDQFTVVIYLEAEDSACKGLGTLEMAKDALKNIIAQRAARDAMTKQRSGIVLPGQRKNGGLNVH